MNQECSIPRDGFEEIEFIAVCNSHRNPLVFLQKLLPFFHEGLVCVTLSSIHERAAIENQPCFVGKERKFESPSLAVLDILTALGAYADLIAYDDRTAWSFLPRFTEKHWLRGIWLNLDYAKSLTIFSNDASQLDTLAAQLSEQGYFVCDTERDTSEALSSPLRVPSVYEAMTEQCMRVLRMKPCD